MALAIALGAELLYGTGRSENGPHARRERPSQDDRLQAWRALGEAPLDVVARELERGP